MSAKPLKWQVPSASPEEIIHTYTKIVGTLPRVKVWARVEGTKVHFITSVPDDKQSERAVYEAELQMMDVYGHDVISFDVYRAALPEGASADARLVLSSA